MDAKPIIDILVETSDLKWQAFAASAGDAHRYAQYKAVLVDALEAEGLRLRQG